MRPEETVDFNIKVSWHAIYRMYNQQASKYDLTTTIGFVLLNIDRNEGTPATKIAPLLGMESRSLTRILKAMEDKKLIFRKRDPVDGRSVRIYLTKEGLNKREISSKTVKTFNNAVKQQIPRDQLETFFDVMNKVNLIIEDKKLFESINNST